MRQYQRDDGGAEDQVFKFTNIILELTLCRLFVRLTMSMPFYPKVPKVVTEMKEAKKQQVKTRMILQMMTPVKKEVILHC